MTDNEEQAYVRGERAALTRIIAVIEKHLGDYLGAEDDGEGNCPTCGRDLSPDSQREGE